jgi:hypothetical protein
MTPDEASRFIGSNAGKIDDAQIAVVWWSNGQCCITFGMDGKYCHIEMGDAAGSVFRGVIDKLEDATPKSMEDKLAPVRAQIEAILSGKN